MDNNFNNDTMNNDTINNGSMNNDTFNNGTFNDSSTFDSNTAYTTYANTGATSPVIEESKRGRGILGAFLGALLGGILWGIIGCLGFISGWIAVLIFFLAQLGYKKFSGSEDKFGIVISAVFGLLVIIPATYASYAFSVFKALNEGARAYFTYWEVLADLPLYMDRYDLWGQFLGNLGMGYLLTGVAAVYMFFGSRKKRN